jgi:hypothetical protein
MSLPDSFMMRSPSPTPDELEDRKYFLQLVEGMDLPSHRVLNHDYRWIIRNGAIRNANHPKLNELMEFIKRKICDEQK